MRHFTLSVVAVLASLTAFQTRADNASKPVGDPVLDLPTLHCLGAYWVIQGDDNRNARVESYYRKSGGSPSTGGDTEWHRGPDLFRVEKNDGTYKKLKSDRIPTVSVPPNAWLFAGSVFLLEPDTGYELKLKLVDPDGGDAEKVLTSHTMAEPVAPANAPTHHVIPGAGGGDGTASSPFKGLAAAQAAAKPGDIFLLHAGKYEAPFQIGKDGAEGKPIVWRGAGDGEAIIDAGMPREKLQGSVIELSDHHDVWFENLSIRGAYNTLKAHDSYNIVLRRCHITDVVCGVFALGDKDGKLGHFFIADNLFEGIFPWPCTDKQWHELPESRAIWLGGRGNVVCYNRIHHFKDGMDMAEGAHMDSCDFHNNDVSECFDDGVELDGSERNTRCYLNRFTNVFQGISFQPVYGGPAYAFRNVIYNCQVEPFKLHNMPSGALMIHNTIVRNGPPTLMQTGEVPSNCYSRNNLYVGTGGRALHYDPPKMPDCDFDFDGFGAVSGDVFLKWAGIKYATLEDVRAKCPVEKHCTLIDPKELFQSGMQPPDSNQKVFDFKLNDLRLKEGSAAIDAGEILPGLNDGFKGKAPDLGAYELGAELPHYGPRPETK